MTTSPRRRRRFLQFGLGTILFVVAVSAVLLAWWLWQPFLPRESHVTGPYLIDAKSAEAIFENYSSGTGPHQSHWVIFPDESWLAELEALPEAGKDWEPGLGDPETEVFCYRTISGRGLSVHGTIAGELIPAANVYHEPNGGVAITPGGEKPFTMHLHYEGKFPQGHLVFFQRFDANLYLALLYDVTP